MKRNAGWVACGATLVAAFSVLRTAHAEQPPAAMSYQMPPPQMGPPGYYMPYAVAPYPAPAYAAAPYSPAYPAYPPPPFAAPPPVASNGVPPTYDAEPQYCAHDDACGPAQMCSEGRCVAYRTENYGGWVALGHLLLGPVGSSAVHFARHQTGKGFLSLGAGTGSFLLGGALACDAMDHGCSYGEFLAGAIFGYIAFALIDVTVVATRKVPAPGFVARPLVMPTQNGAAAGVQARF